MKGQKLETVTSFKYLGSVITDEGSKPEILPRIAQTTATLTRLKPVWIDESISLSSKLPVNHGPSQQSLKEEARYYTSHTKTVLPTRKSVPRSSRQLDHTTSS